MSRVFAILTSETELSLEFWLGNGALARVLVRKQHSRSSFGSETELSLEFWLLQDGRLRSLPTKMSSWDPQVQSDLWLEFGLESVPGAAGAVWAPRTSFSFDLARDKRPGLENGILA